MGTPPGEMHSDHHHRDITGGAARAAVFGISDGIVSNVALILGVAGASASPGVVRLAGFAGLLGGAFSMASGEYGSVRAQVELYEREIELERGELSRRPDSERRELVMLYESRGIDPKVAKDLAAELMRNPELALETHVREELGIDPSSLGNPLKAAAASFVAFAVGAVIPLLPWYVTSGALAVILSSVLAACAAVAVGVALAAATQRSWPRLALRQLLLAALPASVTYMVGTLVGVNVS